MVALGCHMAIMLMHKMEMEIVRDTWLSKSCLLGLLSAKNARRDKYGTRSKRKTALLDTFITWIK